MLFAHQGSKLLSACHIAEIRITPGISGISIYTLGRDPLNFFDQNGTLTIDLTLGDGKDVHFPVFPDVIYSDGSVVQGRLLIRFGLPEVPRRFQVPNKTQIQNVIQ